MAHLQINECLPLAVAQTIERILLSSDGPADGQ